MQIRTLGTLSLLACLFSAAGGAGCGSSPSSPGSTPLDPAAFAQKYKIADNQVPGWTQDPSTDPSDNWSGTDVVASGIDGGNMFYDSNGFRQGLFQTLDGPDGHVCNMRDMDFGDEAHATKMFTAGVKSNTATLTIPPFDISIAGGETVIGGITAVAHFKASYFELFLTAYFDSNLAISDAALFLQVLQSDTK